MAEKVILIVSSGSEGGYSIFGIASDAINADRIIGQVAREHGLYSSDIHYYEVEIDKDLSPYGVPGKELDITKPKSSPAKSATP